MYTNRREFLARAAVAATSLAGAARASGQQTAGRAAGLSWVGKRGRIYFYDQYALNEQATAFAKYDPDRITRELVATGADVVVVYAANQFSVAYYPSKVWPQHPNLKGRDYVGELFTRLRKHGKKVAAYINWLESRHAEWNTIPLGREDDPSLREFPLVSWADPNDPERRVQNVPGGKWRYPCINSPRRAQIVAATREIVERYRPDAFCLDMFHVNSAICVCRYCRPTLEKICGTRQLTMQAVRKNWRQYIDWKLERSASLVAEISEVLRPHGVASIHNAGVPLPVAAAGSAGEQWMPHLDVCLLESFSALEVTTLSLRGAQAANKPAWQLLTSNWPGYAHLSVPPAWWQVLAATSKANNAGLLGPCGTGAFPDTTTSKELLRNVTDAFDRFMQDSDLFPGARSQAKVALVFAWANRKYFREGAPDANQELRGWSQLLLREHIPFDLLIAEQSRSVSDLSRYDLLILPNVAHLSDGFCALLETYVRAGGRLLAVGESSRGDERGFLRKDFALAGLLGISWNGAYTGHFAIETTDEPRPITTTMQQVRTTAKVISRMIQVDPAGSVNGSNDPLPLLPGQWPREVVPLQPAEWPLAVSNDSGKGRTMYLAFDAGRFYGETGAIHIGAYMTGLIDSLMQRQIRFTAPHCIEATVYAQEKPKRTIIHLANRSQSPNNLIRITELLPIHNILIELPSPYPRADVTSRGGRVQTRREGRNLRIRLDALHDYAAVVITQA